MSGVHRVSLVFGVVASAAIAVAQPQVESDSSHTSVHEHVVSKNGREIRVKFRNGEEAPPEAVKHIGDGVFQVEDPETGERMVFDVGADVARTAIERLQGQLKGPLTVIGPEGGARSIIIGPDGAVDIGVGDFQVWPEIAVRGSMLMETPKVMIGVQLDTPHQELAGHFGLEPDEATLLTAVYPDLPAAKAGLERYDLVVAVDGERPAGRTFLRRALKEAEPGDVLRLTVLHRGAERDVEVALAPYDEKALAAERRGRVMDPEEAAVWRLWEDDQGPLAHALVAPPDMAWTAIHPLEGHLFHRQDADLTARIERLEGQIGRLEGLLARLLERMGEEPEGAPEPVPPPAPAP